MHEIPTLKQPWILNWQIPATYDEVMLDWAAAELTSPDYEASFCGELYEALREKITGGGIEGLTTYERTWLIGAFAQFRSPIIGAYGPFRSWGFQRKAILKHELSRFAIVHHFPYPSFSLGELSSKIRDHPTADEVAVCDSVLAIIAKSMDQRAYGLPIAVAQEAPNPPILIEGYKRSLAALWKDDPEPIEIYLCDPSPAGASSTARSEARAASLLTKPAVGCRDAPLGASSARPGANIEAQCKAHPAGEPGGA
jgi:hypothetical protein